MSYLALRGESPSTAPTPEFLARLGGAGGKGVRPATENSANEAALKNCEKRQPAATACNGGQHPEPFDRTII
jgi:hypothetical protein